MVQALTQQPMASVVGVPSVGQTGVCALSPVDWPGSKDAGRVKLWALAFVRPAQLYPTYKMQKRDNSLAGTVGVKNGDDV